MSSRDTMKGTLMKSRYISLIAALIISLTLTPSLSIAGKSNYQYKIGPLTGKMQPVPKGWDLKYNNIERRWVWAPKHARLVYDMTINEWVYIPSQVAR